jgi:signal transduction histidine kinase
MRATSAWTRPLALYLGLVALPTALLLGLGIDSLYREMQAVRKLTEANRQILAEQLAAELERSAAGAISRCLHTADLRNLPASLAACPFASEFFLFESGIVRYPDRVDGAAARLREDLRFMPRLQPGEVFPLAYAQGEPAQFFYMQFAGSPPDRILAVRVNLDYISSVAFRSAEGVMDVMGDLVRRDVAGGDRAPSCFRVLFPFWSIRAKGRQGGEPSHRDLAIFGTMYCAVLLGLAASVSQLLRVYARQWRIAEARTILVSRFSHELKMPLANIRLYADLLGNGGIADPENARFPDIIISQAEQLTRRVNKVLGAALIDQGRRKYDLRDADLARIVTQTIERHGDWAAQQGFTLQAAISPVGAVLCDPEAVTETLVSLLENALKYSGSSRVVRVAVRQDGGAALVEVEDHGIGIPAAERGRIFEEFYRASNSRKSGGFGLGLFLARHAMDAHGGSIEVESEPGRGSRFRLRFPTHANDPDR